jgi:hypothetical protein
MHAYLSRPNCHLPIPIPVFGAWIHHRRLEVGLSCARAAAAAGLELAEWKALEQGWVPTTDDHLLRSIAGALEVKFDDLDCAIAPLVAHFAAAAE